MADELTIKIEKAGLLSSLQDLGDPSLMHLAVPVGGAMDKKSAGKANLLVGNEADTTVMEITLMGPQLHFDQACCIALTGAELSPVLDGKPIPMYQSLQVEAGQRLGFGRPVQGCRTYLAVGGKWINTVRNNGLLLPPLKKGDEIHIVPSQPESFLSLNQPIFPDFQAIRVLAGPEFSDFNKDYIANFFSQAWSIGAQSNRMGYRLEAESLPDPGIREILSSGILPGSIQVLGSGQAVILLADAQTTGGYPRIAVVKSQELDKVGQLKPGDQLRFIWEADAI